MRRTHLIVAVASTLLQLAAPPATAEEHPRFVFAPAGLLPANVVDGRGQIRAARPDRPDRDLTLDAETTAAFDATLAQVSRNTPRFSGGILELRDGRRFVVDRQAGKFVVSPAGGAVGRIPRTGTAFPDRPSQVIGVTNRGGEPVPMTGPEGGGLVADNIPPCGADTSDPTTHCAMSTVRLISEDDGLFCTGVAITDRHVLTAAHCLCDIQRDGQLDANIHAKFGTGNFFYGLNFEPRIDFFSGGEGTLCASGQTTLLSQDNGDLAVLTLRDPDPDDDLSPLATVAAGIMARGETAGVDLDAGEVIRLRALLGQGTPDIWAADPAIGNGFATWGFGEGPDGAAGTKRAMIYPFETLLDCSGDTVSGQCQGLQEALFRSRDDGLCAGDSGAGVFKPAVAPADTLALEGYGAWALMGIVSGDISPADCFNPDGMLLADQLPRNVTRIDTPAVAAWLDTVTNNQVRRSPVRMTFDVRLAGDP